MIRETRGSFIPVINFHWLTPDDFPVLYWWWLNQNHCTGEVREKLLKKCFEDEGEGPQLNLPATAAFSLPRGERFRVEGL